jgi:predicted alpha/beta superfamily hydrolase
MKKYVGVLLLLTLLSGVAMAKPDLSRPMGMTVADQGSAYYDFTHVDLEAQDGARHYRVWLGVPQKPAPPGGHPVVYLLDGNAALAELSEALLRELDGLEPPVIVAIGYATDLRFDATARAYDYTPPLPDGEPVIDDIARERRGGGADLFLDMLEQRIKPWVEARARIDVQRQSLWGHSYAGLLTLHALFTRPHLFTHYIAADPSLWWQQGFVLQEARDFCMAPPASLELTLLVGDADAQRVPEAMADPLVRARRQAMAAVPADAATQMALQLAALPGALLRYQRFTGVSHGAMLAVSLAPALRLSAGEHTAIARLLAD